MRVSLLAERIWSVRHTLFLFWVREAFSFLPMSNPDWWLSGKAAHELCLPIAGLFPLGPHELDVHEPLPPLSGWVLRHSFFHKAQALAGDII